MKGKIIIVSIALTLSVLLASSAVIANYSEPKNDANNDENDDVQEAGTAGGGGWFMEGDLKNTFGFYLNVDDLNNSSLVFHARQSMMTIHAIEFIDAFIEDDDGDGNWTAHAFGNATVNKMENFTFHLEVTDGGKRDKDVLHLWVESDSDTYHWAVEGLGGGNVWIYA